MASLAQLTINWTGFVGGPGFTNLFFRNASPGIITQPVVDDAVTKVDAFLTAVRATLPSTAITALNPAVREIDDTNGNLVAFWASAPAAGAAGGLTGAYAAPAGACIAWSTNTVRNARRIRGRTFLVPLGGSAQGSDGTIDTAELTTITNAAIALRAASGASRLVIWGRPTTPIATDGVSAEVTSSNVLDKMAILTSRRD